PEFRQGGGGGARDRQSRRPGVQRGWRHSPCRGWREGRCRGHRESRQPAVGHRPLRCVGSDHRYLWRRYRPHRAAGPSGIPGPSVGSLCDSQSLQIDNPGGEASNADVAMPLVGDGEKADAVATESPASGRLVTVRSDVLEVTIDTYGGDIVRTALLAHRESLDPRSDPFVILNRSANHTYIAQSGLIGPDGTDQNSTRPRFQVSGDDFALKPGEDTVVVPLVYRQGDVTITKQFILRRGDYLLDVAYSIDNQTGKEWRGHLFGQIQRDTWQPPAGDGFGMQPYLGAAITTPEENYKKVPFADLAEAPFTTEKLGGWVSMVQHYFIS